jgi:hypothetical protein
MTMPKPILSIDERTSAISGKIAFIFLVLTQTALLVDILYGRFIAGNPPEAARDIRLILFVSVFGYIAARLYYAVILPVPTMKLLASIYIGLVLFLLIVLSLWLGLPKPDNWQNTVLPVLLGPAVLLGLYWLLAYLGNRRLDKQIDEE